MVLPIRPVEDGSIGSWVEREGERAEYSGPQLPEDIWCNIYSLLPMRDAARAACVSRAFLSLWRCHPNLTFSMKALGMNMNACGEDEIGNFTKKVDHILKNRSRIGVKTLRIVFRYSNAMVSNVDRWLQTAVTPGIEELTVQLTPGIEELTVQLTPGIEELTVQLSSASGTYYNFPWSLLANGNGNSMQRLHISRCVFSPSVELGLKNMTRLDLCYVCITEEQLGCLLHNCFVLQWMRLSQCSPLTCLKIPFHLQQLRYLKVFECRSLQVIGIEAPNLVSFNFHDSHQVQISFGAALQLKKLGMSHPGAVCYARADLPLSLPNVGDLSLSSCSEMVDTPMLPSKFLHLKYLSVSLCTVTFSPAYDYCSLISFFDASPSLETFFLNVLQKDMKHESIVGDHSNLRQVPGHRHDNLKTVKIIGFSSAKSLVELTCHIIENARSLECLTLDTTRGHPWASCSSNSTGKCLLLHLDFLAEARKGLSAIRTYVEPKVPSRVKLNVVEPCRRCHDLEPTP
ncbi:hypothetical protein ACQJBY_044631 [Aegilops geniculata]